MGVSRPRVVKARDLRIGTWNKGGANQELRKKINEITILLHEQNLDCLGVTEANLQKDANLEDVNIPGYSLVHDMGKENNMKKNSRVVAYIKEELCYEIVRKHMEGDLMPEIWIKLGHAGTRRTLVCFVYREHKPWKSRDDSVKGQENRLRAWLEARRSVWGGEDEAFLLGDINLDWNRQGDQTYRNSKMLKNLERELAELGWTQLVTKNTHFCNRNGVVSETLIDHVWTNCPVKVRRWGQEETAASDHHLVWVERSARNIVEKVKKTEKRIMKNFKLEDLEELCRSEEWNHQGNGDRTKDMLEQRVKNLETKIRSVLDKVAPMKIKNMVYRGKPRWISKEIDNHIRERHRTRRKANRTKSMADEQEARRIRNIAAKKIKTAKLEYLKKKMENLTKNSPDAWSSVNEYLGWKQPMTPTKLVQDGKVITKGPELAEAMLKQYQRKEEEVQQSLGEASGNYLAAGRKLTSGNKAVFGFSKGTKEQVQKQIQKVDNKESFGNDRISYGFLKKMSKWIAKELTEIMNLSLEVKCYPECWKVARVKPLFKGEGSDRQAPKAYRPVALLSGMSRIFEALLAKQLDQYQEDNNLVHQGVHGYRKGRGTNTAMLEVWEFVLKRTEQGELVALDFPNCSAEFDTIVHLYILRKMQTQFGMDQGSLEWLSSYLQGWTQYVVVEASRSSDRNMIRGAPQGGGLSPILWRSATNDIPEAGLVTEEELQAGLVNLEDMREVMNPMRKDIVSKMIDDKNLEELSTEEKLDKRMRNDNIWQFENWRRTRTGLREGEKDSLVYKMTEDEKDVITTIYADDTQSRAAAKSLKELEKRNSEGLTKVCLELKSLRLKVNEGKTTYMVLATQGIRRRENLSSQIEVCGKVVKNVSVGKALGLLVSDDLSWRHQTEEVVKSCTAKLHGLWKCTSVLTKEQRKSKAEGIILPRLFYCLETTSTGIKSNMEKLQGVESAAARWVLQRRRLDWSLRGGLKQLGWLSVCQQAAYQTVRMALKVLKEKNPERLYECLTEISDGQRKRKVLDEDRFMRQKQTSRKSWSSRALRWINMMPEELIDMDQTLKASKQKLKEWIKHRVPVRGDRILWGKGLGGRVAQDAGQGAADGPGDERGPDDEHQSQQLPRRQMPQEESETETRRDGNAALVPREAESNTPIRRAATGVIVIASSKMIKRVVAKTASRLGRFGQGRVATCKVTTTEGRGVANWEVVMRRTLEENGRDQDRLGVG